MLEKNYSFSEIEPRHYKAWVDSGSMDCGHPTEGQPYTIMMPPPNVTGNLHMGHALTFTLQDILVRHHRMRGRDVLWQPGMDHAGIATQMMVEKQLIKEGADRHQLGRDGFLDRVWQWKEEYGGQIFTQLERLGASPDWSRQRFTLDEGLSHAVRKVFVDLYRQGLIYRDKRLVNWDPKLQTAISDLEVENREQNGSMWNIKYPIVGKPGRYIVVATTRPETMFGDTGIAVHPEDERYKDVVGEYAELPLVGRKIPVVADEYADPEKGTGAVKITPAHDFNDFEVGRRHDLESINVLDQNGHLNENVPASYQGMERFQARKKVLHNLTEKELLVDETETVISVPLSSRSGEIVEPWLTDQWYVDAATLAQPALEAVETGKTKFVPENWTHTYFDWLRNIQPWCISRQLWWGHRIPVWYGEDGQPFSAMSEEEALADAKSFYGKDDVSLTQDEDVLDTWFSSALWPFSTLGWPEKTPELDRYYPTDVLITGHDIIFFWVARMMMMGLHFMGEVPFKHVYMHALVRDEKGQKMSKTKGNVIDPLEMIDAYGADALRFTMAAMAAPGRDIRFSKTAVEGYRNFATKLWNVARFSEMNGCKFDPHFSPETVELGINRWIISEILDLEERITLAIEAYRFNEAAHELYQFIWGTFCDWYIEFCKPIFSEEGAQKLETQASVGWVLDRILHLLHPFMPYITEELWENLRPEAEEACLMKSSWNAEPIYFVNNVTTDVEDMNWLISVISNVRSVRAEMNIPPKTLLPLKFYEASPETHRRVRVYADLLTRLARLQDLEVFEAPLSDQDAKGAVQFIVHESTLLLPLEGAIDISAEKDRLGKEVGKLDQEISGIEKKLGNKSFVLRAPEEVVEENRSRLSNAVQAKEKLVQALERISC
jgi:valyl-tRNA synthetase